MVVRITCPHCGASNLEGAEWCGQCYQRLGEGGDEDTPAPDTNVAEPATVASESWTCRRCGEQNDISADVCEVCGASIFTTYEPEREPVDPRSALAASIVPGLGMARVGMGGEGLIAGILTVFAVVGGITILLAGEPVAALLFVCGAALWAISARDAYVVATTDRSAAWLQPRTLTIIAVIVLIVTAGALLRALPEGETQQ